jgi:hypothetical protein
MTHISLTSFAMPAKLQPLSASRERSRKGELERILVLKTPLANIIGPFSKTAWIVSKN